MKQLFKAINPDLSSFKHSTSAKNQITESPPYAVEFSLKRLGADLNPAPLLSIERRDLAMECGDFGRFANSHNLLSQCRRFHLDRDEAKTVMEGVEAVVRESWYSTARACGVSEEDCRQIEGAFVYRGFRQKIGENP